MYLHRTPTLIQKVFPNFLWKKSDKAKTIYLTFDDGPIPEVTEFVVDVLTKFNAKATFFCVGENISKHPEVFKILVDNSHRIGNHTYNHLKGTSTNDTIYFDNIEKCMYQSSEISNLFRPPYGKIKFSQSKVIKKKYEIVMWDVLSGDFDPHLSAEDCLKNTIKATRNGSIVVFHDSVKTFDKLKVVLPQFLEHFQKLGFQFHSL